MPAPANSTSGHAAPITPRAASAEKNTWAVNRATRSAPVRATTIARSVVLGDGLDEIPSTPG